MAKAPKIAPPSRRAPRPRPGLATALRTNFLTGLVVVAPVLITFYIIWSIVTFVDAQIVPLVPQVYNPRTYIEYDVPGFGLFIFLVFTTIVGYFTKNLFGRQIVGSIEGWVERMPVVRSIYKALKQIVETILSQSQSSFQKACLIEYPRRGLWSIAFVATKSTGEIPRRAGQARADQRLPAEHAQPHDRLPAVRARPRTSCCST